MRSLIWPKPKGRSEDGAGFRPQGAGPGRGCLQGLGVLAAMLLLGVVVGGIGQGRTAEAAASKPRNLTGQLLVATEELRDPRFTRTVVYMVQHGAGGAMGLVVNRPVGEVPMADLFRQLGIEGKGIRGEIRVHYGGPVEPTEGFVLHTDDYKTQGTRVVRDGMAVTSESEILRAIGTGAGPRLSLFALGYAGWAPGQLEAEIAAGAWIIVPADEALVFDEHNDRKWERAMARRTFEL